MDLTLTGALVAGLATSLHCVGMCGPLACGVGAGKLESAVAYHSCRLFSYALIGGICGSIGRVPLEWFFKSPAVVLPWIMIALLLATAFNLEKKIPIPAFFSRLATAARVRLWKNNGPSGAATLGLLTPLLPCGPLYALFVALLASGSGVRGSELAIAFGLGTTPLLWAGQHHFRKWIGKTSFKNRMIAKRSLAILTAALLAWRFHDTLPQFSTKPDTPAQLPSCCH
jgi:sulfite exporter TauE/SafE